MSYGARVALFILLAVPGPLAQAEAARPVPRFEEAPCPKLPGAEALAKASCGYLVVPENRGRPTGRTIRLMVATYPPGRRRSCPIPSSISPAGRATLYPWRSTGS
jgi:hypothetical protein